MCRHREIKGERALGGLTVKFQRGGLRRALWALACCVLWSTDVARGQTQPAAATNESSPKAIAIDGQPALALDYGDGMGLLLLYSKWDGQPAFRFSVSKWALWGVGALGECGGFLWISKDYVGYTPDDKANGACRKFNSNSGIGEFKASRSQIDAFRVGDGFIAIKLTTQKQDVAFLACPAYNAVPGKHSLFESVSAGAAGKGDSRLYSEAVVALNAATPWLQMALKDFNGAQEKFAEATGSALPLSPDQTMKIASAVKSGDVAEQAGNLREAFDTYLAALVGLPLGTSSDAVDSLRDRLVRIAAKLNPPPPVPEEAKRHLAYALAAIEEGKASGGISKLNDAVDQLNQVLRLAPWRPEAYYNLGVALEQQKRYADAARNLKLYLLAAPNAEDAAAVQQKIYELEYKSGAR
jgi:tetratricopeptide (TPR) repeat protein